MLRDKAVQERRQRELLNWAKTDYGIDPISLVASSTTGFQSKRRSTFGKTSDNGRFFIKDETDFIHKIRNRYIKQKNNTTAIKIQTFVRAALAR